MRRHESGSGSKRGRWMMEKENKRQEDLKGKKEKGKADERREDKG